MAFGSLRDLSKRDAMAISWRDLIRAYWYLLGSYRWRAVGLLASVLAIHFYVLVPPLLVGKMVDFFTGYNYGQPLTNFYIYALVLGVSFVIVAHIRLTLKQMLGDVHSEIMYQIRVRGFEKLMDFSLTWHLEEAAGSKAQRIKNGVEAYNQLNGQITNEIMRSLVSTFGVIVVFSFLRPPYVIFFIIYSLIFWTILVAFLEKASRENDRFYASVEKASGTYVESLGNILTIKTLGADADFKKHVAGKEFLSKEHEIKIRHIGNTLWKSFHTINGICYGVFLFLVGRDVLLGHVTPGAIVIFYGYLQDLIGRSGDMIDTYKIVLNAKSAIGRMMTIFWAKPIIAAGNQDLPADWTEISVNRANFVYNNSGDRKAISGLSLTIPRFAKIGIVGKTGSGKSTVAKLLAGLYSIESGAYKIGDVSFYDLKHAEQTRQLTLVLQETEIFNMSLEENITLMRSIDPELLSRALEISQLSELAAKLPQGLNTLVGEKGYHLSGGERQRVGIARAICKDSPIIIFDEATSSLDSKTEKLIQEALETKLQDKTLIIIAHRVSTLAKTDVIYVFDEGKIVEQGSFNELSADRKSKFHELYKAQQQKR